MEQTNQSSNTDIHEYIVNARKAGISNSAIRQELLKAGQSETDIKAAWPRSMTLRFAYRLAMLAAFLVVGIMLIRGLFFSSGNAVQERPSVTTALENNATSDLSERKKSSSTGNTTNPDITEEYSSVAAQVSKKTAGTVHLKLAVIDHKNSQHLYVFSTNELQSQSLLTIRYDTALNEIDPNATINQDKENAFDDIDLSRISVTAQTAEDISREAAHKFVSQYPSAVLLRSQLSNKRSEGPRWSVVWDSAEAKKRMVVSIDPVGRSVISTQLLDS